MHIFNKRPLGLILCVILSGFSLFTLLSPEMRAIAIAAALLLILYAFYVKLKSSATFKIASIALLASFVLSFIYFEIVFYPSEFYNEEVPIEAKVADAQIDSNQRQSLKIKTRTVDGKQRAYTMTLFLYGNEEIEPGSLISFNAKISQLENGGSFNYKQYYTSRGICAVVTPESCDVIGKERIPLSYYFAEFRRAICDRASELSDEKTSAMLGALLLGERTLLDGQITLDFSRIGITHILSLSGMHVAILMLGVDKFLYILRMGRNSRTILGCIVCFLFMALTGFPVTVCRAGLMLIISSVLYLLTGCKDSITSLLVAAVMIVAIYPSSAVDIGLWLSIVATLGILLASELMNEKYSEDKGFKKLCRATVISITFSFFSILSGYAFVVLSFTNTSSASIISTMVFSPLLEVFMYIGVIMLVCGNFLSLGRIMIFLNECIRSLSAFFSNLPFVFASTQFISVKIIFIIACASFMAFAFMKINNKRRYISFMAVLFVISIILPIGLTENVKSKDSITAVCDNSDKILVKNGGKVLLFDASKNRDEDAYSLNAFLADERIIELDSYMVSDYSYNLPQALEIILKSNRVNEVLLPMPRIYEEEEIAINSFKVINEYRTTVRFYKDLDIVTLEDIEILVPYRAYDEDALAATFKWNDKMYSYMSSGILSCVPASEELFYLSTGLIFGNFGTNYEHPKIIDEFGKSVKYIFIFDEYINVDVSYHAYEIPKLYYKPEKIYID